MAQNTSTAVMQRRHEPKDSLDDFPTPPWATRALMENVLFPDCGFHFPRDFFQSRSCWEPTCNRGYMTRPLREYFGKVYATDVYDYGWSGQQRVKDFLWPDKSKLSRSYDWLIFNPPFRLAQQFIQRAFELHPEGVATIVRTSFLEGKQRHKELFSVRRPNIIAQFTERVPMVKGRVDEKASTATSYCWLIWKHGCYDTEFVWIPPCRKELERPGDYEVAT
ncbi:methyltransferase [Hoeflea sp. TYP-13]|uniref:methyltransferase n=1 Tax=Hoeflea sp. TYP-13 TaxID=3230023 RepID=UPI0034C6639A